MVAKDGAWIADAKIAAGVDSSGNTWPLKCDPTGSLEVVGIVTVLPGATFPVSVTNFPFLVPQQFNYVAMSPTGTNPTTIVYKTGGSGGTTVATLTLTYDGNNNVQTVTRT